MSTPLDTTSSANDTWRKAAGCRLVAIVVFAVALVACGDNGSESTSDTGQPPDVGPLYIRGKVDGAPFEYTNGGRVWSGARSSNVEGCAGYTDRSSASFFADPTVHSGEPNVVMAWVHCFDSEPASACEITKWLETPAVYEIVNNVDHQKRQADMNWANPDHGPGNNGVYDVEGTLTVITVAPVGETPVLEGTITATLTPVLSGPTMQLTDGEFRIATDCP